jgi:hypothetical protein
MLNLNCDGILQKQTAILIYPLTTSPGGIMKTMFMKSMLLAASAVVYSHAIFGIGGQWAPSPGLEVKGSKGIVAGSGTNTLSLDQAKVSGLQGFGLKLWVDAFPFIDIEATSNVQYGFYDLSILSPTDTIPVKFDLKVPGVEGKPAFARIASDVTLLYPFLKFPPLVSIVKIYAGGGITHVLATEILNADFGKKAVDKAIGGDLTKADSPEEVSKILVDAIKDEGLNSSFGFHLEAGAKAKIPVIPIAIFADVKYHFLNSMPKAVDANSMTFEMGAALAF